MPLVDSLLTAIVRSDGDALVLHVGEKPYVVAATGSVELSRQGLGLGAMEGLLAQLLSAEALRSLREMGAVEHELAAIPAAGADRFTVVAARGGNDIWIEVRRHRRMRPPTPVSVAAPAAPMVDETAARQPDDAMVTIAAAAVESVQAVERPSVPIGESQSDTESLHRVRRVPRPAAVPIRAPPVRADAGCRRSRGVRRVRRGARADRRGAACRELEGVAPVVEAPTFELPATETWTLEHVPAIDFDQPLAELVEPTPADEPEDRFLARGELLAAEPAVALNRWPPPLPRRSRRHAASVTIPTVPLAPEPPIAPPPAAAAEPYAVPRYDPPAAAVSPRAPMPRVDPVPEPPTYQPTEPQPTLPGLPPSLDDASVPRRRPTRCPASSCR